MSILEEATLKMWLRDLDSPQKRTRMVAAQEVVEILGLKDVVSALQPDGPLSPPPEWPAADIVPVDTSRDHLGPYVTCKVRTRLGGVLEESVRMHLGPRGTSHQAAIADAYERGRDALERRLGAATIVGK